MLYTTFLSLLLRSIHGSQVREGLSHRADALLLCGIVELRALVELWTSDEIRRVVGQARSLPLFDSIAAGSRRIVWTVAFASVNPLTIVAAFSALFRSSCASPSHWSPSCKPLCEGITFK